MIVAETVKNMLATAGNSIQKVSMYIQKSTSGTNAATTNPKSIIVSGCVHDLELVPLE